jgi:hypothetical protein
MHDLRADLHVADRVIGIGLGIAFPDLDRMRHQLAHGRLKVVVADHPAGDAGRSGSDCGLVDHQHVTARAAAGLLELQSKMIGSA